MSAWRAAARRWLALPPPRCRVESSCEWVALSDGTRLTTRIARPAGGAATLGTLLVRSDEIAHSPRRLLPLLAALLAEQGLAVVLQECRGLRASEGEFAPFVHEASDGADALEWLAKQPWFAAPLALAGFGYGGYAAFAALSRSPVPVERLVVGYAARDPYAWLHAGGALRLSATLEQAFALGAALRDAHGRLDAERALRHRPVREADRVGFRRLDWLREWLDHPRRDAFWESRVAALPARPPETLLLAGFGHPALAAQLADRDALALLASREAVGSVALEIRPGSAPTRRQALALLADALRAAHEFLRPEAARHRPPVRVFERGAARWRESATWPPQGVAERRLYLRGDGRAQSAEGDGRLDAGTPGAFEPSDVFVYDPADATPSTGPRALRGDVLCYASAPLDAPLTLCGPVRAELHVSSDAPVTDFCATLVEVDASGCEWPLCDGIARVEREAGLAADAAQRVVVACDEVCWRVAPGSRLRLEIASASHPRFDRVPNTREEPVRAAADAGVPARQTIFHDAAHASCLIVETVETAGPPGAPAGPQSSRREAL